MDISLCTLTNSDYGLPFKSPAKQLQISTSQSVLTLSGLLIVNFVTEESISRTLSNFLHLNGQDVAKSDKK